MRHISKIVLFVALGTGLVAGSGPAWSDDNEIFTCRDENGVPSFQNDPCPEIPAAPPATIEPATPANRPAPVAPGAKPARAKPASPAIQKRPTPGPPATERRVATWMVVARTEPLPPIGTRNLGKQTFPTSVDRAPTAPSFASPEQTWLAFLAALESGDRGGAAACLTPAAREALGSLDELRSLLKTFSRIDDVGDLGPYWSIQGVRDKQRPKWILFEEMPTGEWKIAGI